MDPQLSPLLSLSSLENIIVTFYIIIKTTLLTIM